MDIVYFFRWWACLLVLGLVMLPLTVTLFRRFDDHGYAFSKVLGLGIVSILSFIASTIHALPFRRWALVVLIVMLVAGQVVWLWKDKTSRNRFLGVIRMHSFWRRVLIEEVVFLIAFGVWTWVRAQTPELSNLEKPMDHGFVAAILDSEYLPAQDMWYAGSGINYYYFGQFITALLCRLTGVGSAVGYNLMVATTFGLAFSTASSLVYDLLRLRRRGGIVSSVIGGTIGAGILCLGGNGHAFIYRVILPFLNNLGVISYTKAYWFADATRYINCFDGSTDATIHEFPFYSFVVADLHAHMLDICFVIVFLALAAAFVIHAREQRGIAFEAFSKRTFSPQIILMGVLLGIMSMTNYWDFAIYMVVPLFVVAYAALIKRGIRPSTFFFSVIRDILILYIVSRLTALAFTMNFSMISSSVELVSQSSPFYEWLVLWYPFLIFAALFMIVVFGPDKAPRRHSYSSRFLAWVNRASLPDFFVFLLLICAIGLLIVPEIIYVKDIYGSAPRANTMFKFTYQAFIMFSLAMGYGCIRVLMPDRRRGKGASVCVGLLVALLVIIPFTFTTAGMNYALRTHQNTLDGLAYISREDSDEAEMIEWIDDNTPSDAVILEANGNSYTEYCRISSSTGRPTVLGWYVHEWLWRNSTAKENERISDIDTIYTSSDEEQTAEDIAKYNVSYIYVGSRERATFTSIDYEKLESISSEKIVFGTSTLYKVSSD